MPSSENAIELPDCYSIHEVVPSVAIYRRLRELAGLTPRSVKAATAGLKGTWFSVVVETEGQIVGMGRIVVDGGLFFQIVDIAVLPTHQRRGLGKAILCRLMAQLGQRLPSEAHVSLFADGAAEQLYARFGFRPTAPASIGMAMWLR